MGEIHVHFDVLYALLVVYYAELTLLLQMPGQG